MLEVSRRGFIKRFSAAGMLVAAGRGLAGEYGKVDSDLYSYATDPRQVSIARMMVRYFEDMSKPVPFEVRTGQDFEAHRAAVRKRLLGAMALDPLPERVSFDLRQSDPLEHPWGSLRKVHYQIWPGIYTEAFLYLPKDAGHGPRAGILSLVGHWPNGKAEDVEQKRCLNLARLGYVVLAPDADHYEDLPIGISHQTHMVWRNIRALDLLQSLPGVDRSRIGVCGGSGGGFQTQMLLGVDHRFQAASIMGFTCLYRETVFPHVSAHGCLHFPGGMTIADMPEVSALGMPVPVQYLTMDDFTGNFGHNAFPAIKTIYERNGHAGRVECGYWPTVHVYDKPKREATYRWMQTWLNNSPVAVEEPETAVFPVPRLVGLETGLAASETRLERLTGIYSRARRYAAPRIADRAEWMGYRDRQVVELAKLLGMDRAVPVHETLARSATRSSEGLVIESVEVGVEGSFRIPVTVIKPVASDKALAPLMFCSGDGREKLLGGTGPSSPLELARAGHLVILPDLRFFGGVSLENLVGTGPTSLMTFAPAYAQDEWLSGQAKPFLLHIVRAWQRDAILWDRPEVGMAVTDILKVVDHLAGRPDVDMRRMRLIGLASTADPDGSVPLAVLFAAILDPRLREIDVDLGGRSFEERSLPPIPFVLWHGDVLQWAACAADRKLTLRNLSAKAGDPAWLKEIAAFAGPAGGLRIIHS